METITNFFDISKTSLEDWGIVTADDASFKILYTDETGMEANPNQRKMLFKKGITNVYLEI